jgi:hypothetical protein
MISILSWFGGVWPRVALAAGAIAVLVAWRAHDVHQIREAERGRIAKQDAANVSKANSAAAKSRSATGGLLDPYARRD